MIEPLLQLVAGGNGAEGKAFARAVQRQDAMLDIDHAAQVIALVEPCGDRCPELGRPVDRRIAAETGHILGQNLRREIGNRMLRLADRHDDRVETRRLAVQEVGKALKGIGARQRGAALIGCWAGNHE
ncbi:hypothetical protein QW131_23085 [Roseibium salinum]|nr:hypothetical protein [Roseibium salinum]